MVCLKVKSVSLFITINPRIQAVPQKQAGICGLHTAVVTCNMSVASSVPHGVVRLQNMVSSLVIKNKIPVAKNARAMMLINEPTVD